MNYKIDAIEGIGPSYAQKLAATGIRKTTDLLEACATPSGRKKMCEKTGISESLILKWTNHADLMRISGIGKQYAELLEAAGVDTVKELKNRNVANLTAKLKEANEAKKLAGNSPAESIVKKWVEQAKALDPKITY